MCLNILSFGTNISGFCPKIFEFLSQHFQKYVQTFDIWSEDFQNVCQYFQFLRQNSRFLSRDFQVSASKCFTTIELNKTFTNLRNSILLASPYLPCNILSVYDLPQDRKNKRECFITEPSKLRSLYDYLCIWNPNKRELTAIPDSRVKHFVCQEKL